MVYWLCFIKYNYISKLLPFLIFLNYLCMNLAYIADTDETALCVCACMRACVPACVRACVCACMHACVRACVRV